MKYKGCRLLKIALAAYFALALLVLGVRYLVLPNIDQWRPQIAAQLSSRLDLDVTLGAIQAEWKGLNPSLRLRNVQLARPGQPAVLEVPQVDARLSWRSLFSLSPQFLSLSVRGMTLDVSRDANDQWRLMGLPIDLAEAAQQPADRGDGFLIWLAAQRHIVLRDATVRWTDALRQAPPLVLEGVTLTVTGRSGNHDFSLIATPPAGLGDQLEARGHIRTDGAEAASSSRLRSAEGRLYVRMPNMAPLAWDPWLPLPPGLQSGQVSMQSWLEFQSGSLARVVLDAHVADARWEFPEQVAASVGSFRLYLDGPGSAYGKLAAGNPDPGLAFSVAAKHLTVEAPELFQHTLSFDLIDADGSVGHEDDGALALRSARLAVVNLDMDAAFQGNWKEGGSGVAGMVDLQGVFRRATVDAIDDYLPSTVDLDAREWMAASLMDGEIADATVAVQGDLMHFPFGEHPAAGDFSLQGSYSGGVIDYLPPDDGSLGWPRLTDMRGTVAMHRSSLRVTADEALMLPTPDMPIRLHEVRADIPDIEMESILEIDGLTSARAEAYLALMSHSPLGDLLDGIFAQSSADGMWQVPLSLTIPLARPEDTTVKGAIEFAGSTVRLAPGMPEFTKVKGVLAFTDNHIEATGLSGQLLGGPLNMEGGVGVGTKGLTMRGRADAGALNAYVGLPGMSRLSGQLPYRTTLQRDKSGGFSLSAESDLKGLGLDFPAPVGKAPDSARKLRLSWKPQADGKAMRFEASLDDALRASLVHRPGRKSASFFQVGAIGLNQPAKLPAQGLSLDIQYPDIDLDAWDAVLDGFSEIAANDAAPGKPAILPDVSQVRLQAGQARVWGVDLDQLTFTARQPQPAQWRVDISSSQTAGTLFWRESKGRIAGRVDANFDRLSLGAEASTPASSDSDPAMQFADDLDIPGVNLHVKKLRLYGHEVGELSVVGVNQARGHLWRLDQLTLSSPAAVLSGTGTWRLSGPQRGLTLDAEAQVHDLGAYLDEAGFKDMTKGGSGTLKGNIEWRNLPWTFSKADLEGQVEIALQDGRFSTPNSGSARLLELLSLQSVKRLAKLEFKPAGLAKEGYPYDNLKGTIAVSKGVTTTDNYRVTGPVGTIVIGGKSNLIHETVDLRAVVIPNLDVSGAAIAAGIAINPIVGVGAFLTQWLLQQPLAKAMTVEYRVSGTWDDPQIEEVAPASKALTHQ